MKKVRGNARPRRPPPPSGVRIPASVLFADLRGLTRLSGRLDPARVVGILDDFFGAITDVAVAQRATIDKLIGDAVLLLYGVPQAGDDDAVRALRTAVDMQRAFLGLRNRWLREGCSDAASLGFGVGVATGELVVANIDSVIRVDHTVEDTSASRAAQLGAAAQAGIVLVDQATYARTAPHCEAEVRFTLSDVGRNVVDGAPVYRCQPRQAGLRVIPRSSIIDPADF